MEEVSCNHDLHTLSEASRRFLPQRNGHPVSPSTLWRWSTHGVRVPDGGRVKLKVWHCGGSTYTTREACQEFIELQTLAHQAPAEPAWPTRNDATERKLRDAGLL